MSLKDVIQGKGIKKLGKKDKFNFSCKQCGDCCTYRVDEDSIIMSPYDVYRIAKAKNMTTSEVLVNYAEFELGSDSRIPLALIKNKQEGIELVCSFQENHKCSIQHDKPGACQMYPLGRMLTMEKDETTHSLQVDYFLQDIGCAGKIKGPNHEHVVEKWFPNFEESEQAFVKYAEFTKVLCSHTMYREFIDHPRINEEMKQRLVNSLIEKIYVDYDTTKDFLPQLEENTTGWMEIQETIDDVYLKLENIYSNDIESPESLTRKKWRNQF